MRCRCRSRVCRGLDSAANATGKKRVTLRGSSLPSCLACTWHGEVSGTLRLLIPLEGKKRQGRRRVGTHVGLIPYSCLVPSRFFPLVRKTPQSGRRCLNHPGAEDRRLWSVRNKTEANDYDVKKLQNGRPWKERTYILRGQITVRRRLTDNSNSTKTITNFNAPSNHAFFTDSWRLLLFQQLLN